MTDSSVLSRISGALLLFVIPLTSFCEIQFVDVSNKAGMKSGLPTAASAWGDLNNDGWPDLWVSNHHGIAPSLYLNQRDGRFRDIASELLDGTPVLDYHGASWADVDNDGDQDLLVVTGGGAGHGVSPNHYFVNESGNLVEKAEEVGLSYPLGRGRTPLWLDYNADGLLDALLMNRYRAEAPTDVFLQAIDGKFSSGKMVDIFKNTKKSTAKSPGLKVADEFAQLADISKHEGIELITYTNPERIINIGLDDYEEITGQIKLPKIRAIRDIAINDFNGDGVFDWFLVRSRQSAMTVLQTDRQHIQGKLANRKNQTKTVLFRSEGEITLDVHLPWMDPSDPRRNEKTILFVGSKKVELTSSTVTVSPSDPAVIGPVPSKNRKDLATWIRFDAKSREWSFGSSLRMINFRVSSTDFIDYVETKGFKPSDGALSDVLLLNENGDYKQRQMGLVDHFTACASAASGDFDNDMDIDLYLVCSGPTSNYPNLLYENDGQGRFVKVARAGGASGSMSGRGNQVSVADFDQDGFLDLFVTNGFGPPPFANEGSHQLFRNAGNSNHWLEIDLVGKQSNRDGIGARLILETGGVRQVRVNNGGMHSFSQDAMRVHFGLGNYVNAKKLTIFWPSGVVQELRNISANQILTVNEES
ncbi:MAG: CRTAC1 family protein [Gammaproteobacteria bacterium]